MQIIQIEIFKFESINVKYINQIIDLFVIFINFYNAVSK